MPSPPAWRVREGPAGTAAASHTRSMAAQARIVLVARTAAGPTLPVRGPEAGPEQRGGAAKCCARRAGATRPRDPGQQARAGRGRRASAPRPARGAHGRPWQCESRRPRRPAVRRPARARRPAARRPSAARTSPAWPPAARRSGPARPAAPRRRLSARAGGTGPAARRLSSPGSRGRAGRSPGRAAPARWRPGAPAGDGAPHVTQRRKPSAHPVTSPTRSQQAGRWSSHGYTCALLACQPCTCRACCVGYLGRATRPRRLMLQDARASAGGHLFDYKGGDAARPGRARARHDQVQVGRARAADEGLGACAARARGACSAPTAGPRAAGRGAVPAGMLAVDCPVAPAAAAMTSTAPHARRPAASLGAEAGEIGRGRSKWSRSPDHRLEHPGSTCPTGTPPPRQSSARERA